LGKEKGFEDFSREKYWVVQELIKEFEKA